MLGKSDTSRKEYMRRYREKHRDHLNAEARRRRIDNPERDREHGRKFRTKNREAVRTYSREYARQNRHRYAERQRAYMAQWREKNYMLNRHYASLRRAQTIHRLPLWADREAIKRFYQNCPLGMVVDHIVPLRGKNVCGLHVLNNLQYLTDHQNAVKYNKHEP